MNLSPNSDIARVRRLNRIGIALSQEHNPTSLLQHILSGARELTRADAGTFYLYDNQHHQLHFTLVQNDTLSIQLGGEHQEPISKKFPTIPVFLEDGTPNEQTIVAWTVIHNQTLNISDAYQETRFDLSGMRAFDQRTGYRSTSFLSIPLHNHEHEIIAVLQLINKLDLNGQPIAFDAFDQDIAESLASQAAVAMSNQQLIADMQTLFDSFVRTIATAIDRKSPHTGGHCRRVPDATLLLAEAAANSQLPALRDFTLDDKDRYEIKTAAWLHDCGKVITPVHIIEKSTKLESIHDRIDLVVLRFEAIRRDLENQWLKECLSAIQTGHSPPSRESLDAQLSQLDDDLTFLRQCNVGGEFMHDAALERLNHLSSHYQWRDATGTTHAAITPEERDLLAIRRGTLSPAERKIIEDHMVHTIEMLHQLPFPKHLRRVPEYAGGHHEKMDGSGYPLGLTREQMSVPARIMGIADVFEALTAPDRPYKKPMKLSQTLTIMGRMVEDHHLDPDLFAVFVQERVYLKYADIHLQPDQIDDVDIDSLPGLHMTTPEPSTSLPS